MFNVVRTTYNFKLLSEAKEFLQFFSVQAFFGSKSGPKV